MSFQLQQHSATSASYVTTQLGRGYDSNAISLVRQPAGIFFDEARVETSNIVEG